MLFDLITIKKEDEIILEEIINVILCKIVQFIMKDSVKKYYKYKDLKYKIIRVLVENAIYYFNPLQLAECSDDEKVKKYNNISKKTRTIAAELRAYSEMLPLLPWTKSYKKRLNDASSYLIGLSNGLYKPYNIKNTKTAEINRIFYDKVMQNLNIRKEIRN